MFSSDVASSIPECSSMLSKLSLTHTIWKSFELNSSLKEENLPNRASVTHLLRPDSSSKISEKDAWTMLIWLR